MALCISLNKNGLKNLSAFTFNDEFTYDLAIQNLKNQVLSYQL